MPSSALTVNVSPAAAGTRMPFCGLPTFRCHNRVPVAVSTAAISSQPTGLLCGFPYPMTPTPPLVAMPAAEALHGTRASTGVGTSQRCAPERRS